MGMVPKDMTTHPLYTLYLGVLVPHSWGPGCYFPENPVHFIILIIFTRTRICACACLEKGTRPQQKEHGSPFCWFPVRATQTVRFLKSHTGPEQFRTTGTVQPYLAVLLVACYVCIGTLRTHYSERQAGYEHLKNFRWLGMHSRNAP